MSTVRTVTMRRRALRCGSCIRLGGCSPNCVPVLLCFAPRSAAAEAPACTIRTGGDRLTHADAIVLSRELGVDSMNLFVQRANEHAVYYKNVADRFDLRAIDYDEGERLTLWLQSHAAGSKPKVGPSVDIIIDSELSRPSSGGALCCVSPARVLRATIVAAKSYRLRSHACVRARAPWCAGPLPPPKWRNATQLMCVLEGTALEYVLPVRLPPGAFVEVFRDNIPAEVVPLDDATRAAGVGALPMGRKQDAQDIELCLRCDGWLPSLRSAVVRVIVYRECRGWCSLRILRCAAAGVSRRVVDSSS